MTDALQGTFYDLKFIKTRKVARMEIEFPIEAGPQITAMFGTPMAFEGDVWVAVARIKAGHGKTPEFDSGSAGSTPAAKKHWNDLPLSQQAGIRCGEPEFQRWMNGYLGEDKTATAVRNYCRVQSRAGLDTNPDAGKRWQALDLEYMQATGKAARE